MKTMKDIKERKYKQMNKQKINTIINGYLNELNNLFNSAEKYEYLLNKSKELEKEAFVLKMKLARKTSEFRTNINRRNGHNKLLEIEVVIKGLKPFLNEYFLASIREEINQKNEVL